MSDFVKNPFTGKYFGIMTDNNMPISSTRKNGVSISPIRKREITTTKPAVPKLVEIPKPVKTIPATANVKAITATGKTPVSSKTAPIQIDPIFNQLLPLQSVMSKALSLKGIPASNRLDILAEQFYNEIVRQNNVNNFTGQSNLPVIHMFEYRYDNVDEAKDAVITGILSYIKNLKTSAEQGKELSEIEKVIYNGTVKVESILTDQAKETASKKVGSFFLFEGGVWIAVVIGLIVIAVAMTGKKGK